MTKINELEEKIPLARSPQRQKKERKMQTIKFRGSFLATALLMLAIAVAPALAQEGRPPAGRVAYHFVSRLLQSPSGTFFVIGYVNFLDGVSAPLFTGTPGEKTALITFRSNVISAAPLLNGNVVVLNWSSTPFPRRRNHLELRQRHTCYDNRERFPDCIDQRRHLVRHRSSKQGLRVTHGSRAIGTRSPYTP